ncbi:hypothetical protein ACN4EG_19605 [Alkalinema pantanalense CENA528]|uniref:hypothetical protein n=1 Tax=Alkalinema pantanalense TaxID=1620705 RepID=UPI003D6FE362
MEPGVWLLQGSWTERNGVPITVKGKVLVSWSRDEWFNMVMRLIFVDSDREPIDFQYRGRFDMGDRRYTFVLQHSDMGHVEGEGWLAPESIVQHYRAIGDKQRRSGFETMYRFGDTQYYMSSGILSGHYMTSSMEAVLERQVS